MTIAVKVLLTVALIFSIAVPFGAFAAGENVQDHGKKDHAHAKGDRSYKNGIQTADKRQRCHGLGRS